MRPSENAQHVLISELLIGLFKKDSTFYPLCWSSHLSKLAVKSIASAEVSAAGIAMDEGRTRACEYTVLLEVEVHITIAVDLKGFFTSMSPCQSPENKSTRGDA